MLKSTGDLHPVHVGPHQDVAARQKPLAPSSGCCRRIPDRPGTPWLACSDSRATLERVREGNAAPPPKHGPRTGHGPAAPGSALPGIVLVGLRSAPRGRRRWARAPESCGERIPPGSLSPLSHGPPPAGSRVSLRRSPSALAGPL